MLCLGNVLLTHCFSSPTSLMIPITLGYNKEEFSTRRIEMGNNNMEQLCNIFSEWVVTGLFSCRREKYSGYFRKVIFEIQWPELHPIQKIYMYHAFFYINYNKFRISDKFNNCALFRSVFSTFLITRRIKYRRSCLLLFTCTQLCRQCFLDYCVILSWSVYS